MAVFSNLVFFTKCQHTSGLHFPCFLPLTLKISKLPSKIRAKNTTGLLIVKGLTSCINVGREKGWLTASWEVWREIIFYFVVFSACSKCLRCSKIHHCAWKFTIPVVVIIQKVVDVKHLKQGHSSVLPSYSLFSLSLFLYSNLIALKCSFTEIKRKGPWNFNEWVHEMWFLKNRNRCCPFAAVPLSGYFYFFLSQRVWYFRVIFFANHLLPNIEHPSIMFRPQGLQW